MSGIEYIAIGAFGMAEGLAIMLYSIIKSSKAIGNAIEYENKAKIVDPQILKMKFMDNHKYLNLSNLGAKFFIVSNFILLYGIDKSLEEIIK